jgi:Ohr subfamily peroxiredoxin
MAGDRTEDARPTRILYTAEAVVQGGRLGTGRTSDGRLAVYLSVPKELGGDVGTGTNPEQLLAPGYDACFHNALLGVARGLKLDASDFSTTARVGIGPTVHGGTRQHGLGCDARPERPTCDARRGRGPDAARP